jgi:hypothetical protein
MRQLYWRNKCYLPKINGKFSRPAADPADAHVPLGHANLGEIMCFEHERAVANDYVVRFECRFFQILRTSKVLPRTGDKVTVRVRLDGSISILRKGKPLLNENRGDKYTEKRLSGFLCRMRNEDISIALK